MNQFLKVKLVAFAAIVVGLTIASLLIQHPKAVVPTKPKPIVASIAKQSYRGLPVRLVIPAINVDTTIEYVGNNAMGDMDTSKSASDVAWYKYGALPGDPGSAVIAGHVVGLNGQAGAFVDLSKLQKGDVISVIDAKGLSASFIVRLSQTYDPSKGDSEVFNSSSGTHLNLITCSGDWDATSRHYLSRLVVFADKTS